MLALVHCPEVLSRFEVEPGLLGFIILVGVNVFKIVVDVS